jgi:hypothetical protein
MSDKKKFKDTAVGRFISQNAPKILDVVDDYLPPVKILTELLKGESLPPEKQIEFEKLLLDYEKDFFTLEIQDKQNARAREVEMARAGKKDWFMQAVGIFVLICFAFMCYVSVYLIIPAENREQFLDLRSTIRDAVIAIIFYYFGSSKGSADKTKMLK